MSRNKLINEKIKDERREQILSVALRIFAVKGLPGARISDISKQTGISQGLIYHYFRSKEEIFTSLVSRAIDNLNQAAITLEKMPLTPREKITLAVTELLKGIELPETAFTFYFLISQATLSESVPEKAHKIIKENNAVKYEVMERIFAAGQKEGSVKGFSPQHLSVLFWSVINGLALTKAINLTAFSTPDKDIILDMFLKA